MTSKKRVAWQVRDDCEGHAVIVFHHHGMAARREGANELGSEFEYVECSRAKQYDEYADKGYVPPLVLINDGWWFECCHCGRRCEEEGYDYDTDEPIPVEDMIEAGRQSVYCNQSCKDAREAEIKERNEKFEAFKEKILESRPDLDFTEWTGGWPWITMTGKFMFPGSKYGGSVRDDEGELTWWIANGDKDAWDEYESAQNVVGDQFFLGGNTAL